MKNEPWFREFDGWWYVYVRKNGKRRQVKLAQGKDNKAEAYECWVALRHGAPVPTTVAPQSVVALLDLFLDHCSRNLAPASYDLYRGFLQTFCSSTGNLTLAELKPLHVTAWLDAHPAWSPSTRNCAVRSVRRGFNWLTDEGHIDRSPVKSVKAPRAETREVLVDEATFGNIMSHTRDGNFRDFLTFVRHSGCRPQEAVKLEAHHVELSLRRIVFPTSQAKGKRAPRVIYLDDTALEIVERLVRLHPTGTIFRNRRGGAWNKNSVRCRFRRLKDKVGGQYCTYHLRHTFATDALQKLDPITVAVLMGHSDATTLARTYQHLAKLPEVMIEAAKKATSGGA